MVALSSGSILNEQDVFDNMTTIEKKIRLK